MQTFNISLTDQQVKELASMGYDEDSLLSAGKNIIDSYIQRADKMERIRLCIRTYEDLLDKNWRQDNDYPPLNQNKERIYSKRQRILHKQLDLIK